MTSQMGNPIRESRGSRAVTQTALPACFFLLCILLTAALHAQTYQEKILYSFDTKSGDAVDPTSAVIVDSAGNVYGTTFAGGLHYEGAVFRVNQQGQETILYSFTGGADGALPQTGLLLAAGTLYGSTTSGGAFNHGAVFEISGVGKEKVLYSFQGGSDGSGPSGTLARDAGGNLYGTTSSGGKFNSGTVFKIAPDGTESILHSFGSGSDGMQPSTGLIQDPAGDLYGTTTAGGVVGWGTVFRVSQSGAETVLFSFPNFQAPSGLIRDAGGNFYGTGAIASENGNVFRISPAGKEVVLHSFGKGSDGEYPYAGVIRDAAGNLYGSTYGGGDYEWGTVFKIDPTGKETVLYSFQGNSDGAAAEGGIAQDAKGNLYGTTKYGGAAGGGILFELEIQ